jgi:Flp pilus assembly protein TadD
MRPTDPDARVSLGNALLQKGRIDEAIAHYQQAITAQPDHFLARYSLGHALLEKGDLDGAIQVCRSALLLRDSDADCHTTLAIALEEKGNPAEAIPHYRKALELSPQSIPTLTNLAWLLATSQDASLRNGPKAVELARQADRLTGGANTLVLRTLAAAYAETGEFGNAIRTARSAMQLTRMHGEDSRTTDLDQQIRLYQLGIPYRETAK